MALAHSHARTLGGGERAVLEVARRLSPRYRVRLLLGGFAPGRTYPELAALPHVQLQRLDWLTTQLSQEVVIANSFGANLLALRNGRRVGYWVHSLRSLFLLDQRHAGLRVRRLLDWLAVRRTGVLIANSRYTAGRLKQLYGRAADAVVYPGVDLKLFRSGEHAGRFAVTVGRLAPEKGLDRLLEVWQGVRDIPLHVVGGGALSAKLPENVVVRGPLPPRQVAEVYRQAAFAVFAPRNEEFGIAALEAMASGLPVVGWREGGLLETIVDGHTGFLTADVNSFRERVLQLANHADLRRALGDTARRRAEGFSWERTAAGIEQATLRLAAASARRDPAPQP